VEQLETAALLAVFVFGRGQGKMSRTRKYKYVGSQEIPLELRLHAMPVHV
jgi:hypothetical protein